MRNRRGLSQVVTTMILIVLILAAVAGLWVAASSFLQEGAEEIEIGKFTLGLSLKKAVVDYDTGLASVRVKRESGKGELTSIKFIVEDDKSSEVYEEFFNSFPELAERTFVLNLTKSEFLTLKKVYKISIAPVFSSSSGNLVTGDIAGSIGGLNDKLGDTGEQEAPKETQCSIDSQCPPDSLEPGTKGCNPGKIMITQTKNNWFCNPFSQCRSAPIYDFVVYDCAADGMICWQGACISEEIACTSENVQTVCGKDGPSGNLKCHSSLNATAQDKKVFTCDSRNKCDYTITEEIVKMCNEGDFCHDGGCFTPNECTTNVECCSDEDPYCGRICNDDYACEDEVARNVGFVGTAWPPGIGEYFDSMDLNSVNENKDIKGQLIIFPGSAETRCMYVRNFVHMNSNGVISYVQLNETTTNISNGDAYQAWETPFGCTKI